MRNLKIVRKCDSNPAYNHPLFFCVGDHSTLIAIDENDERNSGRLVRVFNGKQEVEEIHRFSEQELELLHPLDKIIELIYDRVTDSVFLATSTGGFYQYSIGSEGLEELFMAPSGIVAFALSPDSRLLTVGTKDETVILFSFPDLEMLSTIELRQDTSTKVEESGKETTTTVFDITFAWRHDSHYFAINYILGGIQRKIQVYDEFGKLYSTTEDCNPIAQGSLAWQPSGGLIGTLGFLPTCPSPTNLDTNITFFELNGLKRSDFNPIEGRSQSENKFPVLDILWNCNSDVLALRKETCVELWIRSNYVWMCKQTIYAEETAEATDTIVNTNTILYVAWDTEIPHRLHVIFSDGRYCTRDFIFSFSTGVSAGSALTASINGPNIYCTPFRDTCAPPPTCRFQARLSSLIQEVVVTNFWDGLLCILNTGELVFLKNCVKSLEKLTTVTLSRKASSSSSPGDTTTPPPKINLQTCYSWIWPSKSELSCISNGNLLTFELSSSEFLKSGENSSVNAAVVEGSIQFSFKSSLAVRAKSILPIFKESELMGSNETKFLLVQKRCGAILLQELNVMPNKFLGRLPDTVHEIHYLLTTSEKSEELLENTLMIFGFDPLTRQLHSLYKNVSLKLMNDVKSLGTFQNYLLVTTVQGSLEIIELKDLLQIFKDKLTHHQNNSMNILSQQPQPPPSSSLDHNNLSPSSAVPSYSRKVEKGSIIVNCCWNRVLEPALTLQIIPRGNIETISPRPLIISSLAVLLTKKKYNEVMIAMRRHRFDFNVLAHQLKTLASPDMTLQDHLTAILEDTQDSHTLVLMVTELGDEHSDCVELLQGILQQKLGGDIEHVTHNVNTRIINPYLAVMAKLGLYETVLRSPLISGQDLNRDVVKSRVKFLSFYCDNPEILYDSALGTYDLNLTSLVADCLNKDPKEYLPILNEYRSLDGTKLKFTIDNKLKRYSKAVLSLLEHSETTGAESVKYIERHKIHQTVIAYLDAKGSRKGEQDESLLKQVYTSYGHLFEEHKKLSEAAICYSRGGDFDKSFECHGRAGNWTLALDLLAQNDVQGLDSLKEYYTKLIHHLEQIKEYEAAAQIAENYLQDKEEAFKFYIKAHHWGKASLMKKLRLKELTGGAEQASSSSVQKYEEELFDAAKTLVDNCVSTKEEINCYTVRLAVVKKIKEQQALDPHGFEHDNFSDTESVSTTSSFRSSSVSSTLNSGKSYKSGKNARKLKRKIFSLKEGSRFEDIAIIAHLWEICHRVQTELKPEVEAILPHLWHVSGGDERAIKVSETFEALMEEGDQCTKQVWATVLPQNEFLELKYSSPPANWSLTSWKKCSILTSTAAIHLP